MWNQVYNPFNNAALSTACAALPVVTLLVLIASNKVKAHIAAIAALIVANLVAIFVFTMPAGMSLRASVLGAVTGFFPIGWIVLNVIFLYRLTVEKGVFETLQTTIGSVTTDRRLQLLLIAFSFGAFFEGASGFGTPVAVTGAILIGLGFSPLAAPGFRSSRIPRPLHTARWARRSPDWPASPGSIHTCWAPWWADSCRSFL
jgi:lactate permease